MHGYAIITLRLNNIYWHTCFLNENKNTCIRTNKTALSTHSTSIYKKEKCHHQEVRETSSKVVNRVYKVKRYAFFPVHTQYPDEKSSHAFIQMYNATST